MLCSTGSMEMRRAGLRSTLTSDLVVWRLVRAGVSLIADQAVRVGDVLSLGGIQCTVEELGLRSTRIRTIDRTVVSLPNGQIANKRLETVSVRDKFLFCRMQLV